MTDTGNSKNTYKFYWLNRSQKAVDYPSVYIGEMTPSTFRWTKMRHMIDAMENAISADTPAPVIVSGNQKFTAMEFLQEIQDIKMFIFDTGL